ncbi:MAG: TonB-dependent siderophore receptor [Cyanobacteria bacterium P01_G01_bin.19]
MRFISPFTSIPTSILVTTIAVNFTAPVQAQQLTQITNVDVRETATGIEIVVETADGSKPQFVETPDNNILYIDLVDARLNLASGASFQVDNPAETIQSVTVSEEFAGSVSIVITGTESLPQVELIPNAEGGIFSVTTSSATTQTPVTPPEEEPIEKIEIIVTGEAEEEEEYIAPEVNIGRGNPQSVLDTVQSVQSVTEEVIKDQNISNFSAIADNVSGVSKGTIASQNAGTEFTIRGFGAVQGRENLLRNGLRDDTLGSISGLTNIERVEILKGPSSVLYGQGIVGGTVNLVTKKPLEEPFYSASFTAGNFDTYRGSLDFTEILDEEGGLAYRLNLAYEDENSFKDFQEEQFILADLGLTLLNSENTNLYVGIEYQKNRTKGTAPQLPISGTIIDNPLGEIDVSTNLGEPSLSEFELNVVRLNSELEHEFSDKWKLQNQILASFLRTPVSLGLEGIDSNFTETGLQPDNRSFRRVLIDNPTKTNVFTANTNVVGEFNTGKIEHEFIFGVEFVNREIDDVVDLTNVGDIDVFDPVFVPESLFSFSSRVQDQLTKNNEIGLYLQDQIKFGDKVILALGGRLDFANTELIDGNPTLNAETSNTNFSPRAGLIYKPAENVSLYASYTESFLPNAGRSRETDSETFESVLGDVFEPETGRQYEIGVKSELFDDKVLATLALFDLERNNVLDATTFSSQQIGKQRSRGVEVDIAGEILPGWQITTSYTYLDAEIISDDNDLDNTDSSGNQLRNVPQNAFNIWTAYTLQKGSLEGLGFGVGLFYEDVKPGDLENSFFLPDYLRTDAAIFYEKNDFKAQVNFQNLFDIRYFESARDQARVNPGAPFTVLGTVSVEF